MRFVAFRPGEPAFLLHFELSQVLNLRSCRNSVSLCTNYLERIRLLENWVNLRLWSFLSFFRALKLTPGVSMALLRKMWVRSKRMVGSSMWRQLSSTSSDGIIQDVGFIGLGNMGGHMASNLLKAGHRLTVHDRNNAVMRSFAEKGANTVQSPREVAEASDVVITMLPSSPHVEDVYTGPHGLLGSANAIRPSLLIDASTIDPLTCRTLATKVAKCTLSTHSKRIGAGVAPLLLDAPVSGGVVGAQAATLTFMVGGPSEGVEAARPLLQAMGSRVVHCGGTGNGAAAKVCNNLALSISMAGVAEALALGQQLGIDAKTLSNIFNSSTARCWSSDTYNPVPGVMANVPASRDYKGGFPCQFMVKDLGLALAAAEESGAATPLGMKVLQMYTILCNAGHSSLDFSSIFQHYYKGEAE